MNLTPRLLLLSIACFSLFSCGSVAKSSIKDDGRQIPPDFAKASETLLVIRKGKRSYDKYLEDNFAKNYFGKYIIINKIDLTSVKYQNLEEYRYVFDEDFHQDYISASPSQVAVNRGPASNGTRQNMDYGLNTYAKFQVLDRASGIVYKTKHGTGAFSKWMKAYIQALEKSRQQKAGQ